MRPLFLLHGFTGAPRSYRRLLSWLEPSQWVGIPVLPGHSGRTVQGAVAEVLAALGDPVPAVEGCAERPAAGAVGGGQQSSEREWPDSFEAGVERLAEWARSRGMGAGVVVGYSLGARLALGLVARHPELFRAAVLVGVHPGVEDGEREARHLADEERRHALLTQPLAAFVQAWEAMPLFESQQYLVGEEELAEQRAVRLSHSRAGLAASLSCCGLAQMPNFRPQLPKLGLGVDLVVGERDVKFRQLAVEMHNSLPHARLFVEPGCGHNVVLERPRAVARIITQRLQSLSP